MLHYSQTGKTKSGEIKIGKSVYALLIQTDQAFSGLGNEKITIDIERANNSNTNICNQVNLNRLARVAAHGTPVIFEQDAVTRMLIPIALASVKLNETDSVKVALSDLKAGQTYTVYSIEAPEKVDSPFYFETKTMPSDEVSRRFEVGKFGLAHLTGFDAITEISLRYSNGTVCKYEPAELTALAEADDPIQVITDGVIDEPLTSEIVFSTVGVQEIEIIKSSGTPVYLTLKA